MKIKSMVLMVSVVFCVTVGAQEWIKENYANRMRLSIAGQTAAGNLKEFPICVRLKGGDLFSKIKPDGNGFVFTAADGQTPLPCEVDFLDIAKKELICWVRLPEIRRNTENSFYIYFNSAKSELKNDPKHVWSNGYLAVWHMNAKDGRCPDSLGKFDLLMKDGAKSADGRIGAGVESIGGKSGLEYRYLRGEKTPELPAGASFTLSCWLHLHKADGSFFNDFPIHLFYHPAKRWQINLMGGRSVAGYSYASDSNPLARWVNLSAVYHAKDQTLQLFVDGKPGFLYKDVKFSGLREKSILSLLAGVTGVGDEFTLSNVARSPEWIQTAYENQKNPASVSSGTVEIRPSGVKQ